MPTYCEVQPRPPIQLHPHCIVITDEAAAGRLQAGEYYRWIFDNEPEWGEYRLPA